MLCKSICKDYIKLKDRIDVFYSKKIYLDDDRYLRVIFGRIEIPYNNYVYIIKISEKYGVNQSIEEALLIQKLKFEDLDRFYKCICNDFGKVSIYNSNFFSVSHLSKYERRRVFRDIYLFSEKAIENKNWRKLEILLSYILKEKISTFLEKNL
ncbi:MAG: hypothetical protein QXY16_01965 [Nanopusillaceae archaeon]